MRTVNLFLISLFTLTPSLFGSENARTLEDIEADRRILQLESARVIQVVHRTLPWKGSKNMSFLNDWRLQGPSREISAFDRTIFIPSGVSPKTAQTLIEDVAAFKDLDLQEEAALQNVKADSKQSKQLKLEFEKKRIDQSFIANVNSLTAQFPWTDSKNMSFSRDARYAGGPQAIKIYDETIPINQEVSPLGLQQMLWYAHRDQILKIEEKMALLNAEDDPKKIKKTKIEFEMARLAGERNKRLQYAYSTWIWRGSKNMSFYDDWTLQESEKTIEAFGERISIPSGSRPRDLEALLDASLQIKLERLKAKLRKIEREQTAEEEALRILQSEKNTVTDPSCQPNKPE